MPRMGKMGPPGTPSAPGIALWVQAVADPRQRPQQRRLPRDELGQFKRHDNEPAEDEEDVCARGHPREDQLCRVDGSRGGGGGKRSLDRG